MNDAWTQRWDDRYSGEDFAYGESPNVFLKEQLEGLPPGKILFPAEGEGRNAVYAASLGWTVSAFDISAAGRKKADMLAARKGVSIDYRVGALEALDFQPGGFDAIALIYAHFPAEIKSSVHQALDAYLRPGGLVIFEAFSKAHLAYLARNEKVGGPKDIASLFSVEEIAANFAGYEIILLKEEETDLAEGAFHVGTGSVIRFVGRKL